MPDLFIDYFIMSAFYDFAWLYMTWQPCVAMHVTKLQWANSQCRILSLLVVCCVKMGTKIMSN